MKSLCSIRVLGNPLPFAVGRCCVDNFDQCIQENVCVVESMDEHGNRLERSFLYNKSMAIICGRPLTLYGVND